MTRPIAAAAPAGRASAKLTGPERAFRQTLIESQARGEIVWWAAHPFTLKLGKGLSYTPDFVAVTAGGLIAVYEVKGHGGWNQVTFKGRGRPAGSEGGKSRTKFLAAVEAFPLFAFHAAFQQRKRDGGGFKVTKHEPRHGYGAAYSVCVICDSALSVGDFASHDCE